MIILDEINFEYNIVLNTLQAVCTCPVGLLGDPYVSCNNVECDDNSECPPDKKCINKQCQDPCAIENPCQGTSECVVRDHEPDCTCPPGFQVWTLTKKFLDAFVLVKNH